VTLPGNVVINYGYSRLGQLRTVTDSLGAWTNTYDNYGRLLAVSNRAGLYRGIGYDAEDHPSTVTSAEGVVVSRSYDYLGRLLARQVVGGVAETFAYSARGLTSHTDQLNKTTLYAYDEAGRKTSETTPKSPTAKERRQRTKKRHRVTVSWGSADLGPPRERHRCRLRTASYPAAREPLGHDDALPGEPFCNCFVNNDLKSAIRPLF
jgi:YD repeat-containing protein